MWQRRTFHECANELMQISERFRGEWKSHYRSDPALAMQNQTLLDTSMRGVEILRILALAIRSEQDFGLTPSDVAIVGAIKENTSNSESTAIINTYTPPYSVLADFKPLKLRQALNKIAHANPVGGGFFADANNHDLILTGSGQSGIHNWIVILSIIDLCSAIKSLPDYKITT